MKTKKRIITTIVGLSILGSAVMYSGIFDSSSKEKTRQRSPVKIEKTVDKKSSRSVKNEVLLAVSVTDSNLMDYKPHIIGHGNVEPSDKLSYTSDISGRVVYINKNFKNGLTIKKDDVMIKLDDIRYRTIVSEKKSALEIARINLLEEERESKQAASEWELSGLKGTPSSELVLREPQLKSAKMAYEQAVVSLESAEKDLKNTVIKAPFDAYISETDIVIGSYIQSGTNIVDLYGTDVYEIEVALSQYEWSFLPKDILTSPLVKINDLFSGQEWDGFISREKKEFSTTTRQRSIIVNVTNPVDKGLYSGLYSQVNIDGKEIKNVWKLPSTVISSKNLDGSSNLLIVDENDRIKVLPTNNLYENKGFVYVRPIDDEYLFNEMKIIIKPLITYTAGTKVKVLGE